MKTHYRSIFISDTHFGFKHNRSDRLANFLSKHTCDNLYLVGDIIDLWELQRKFRWTIADTLAMRQIIMHHMRGTKIYYIIGNHDGDLRHFHKHLEIEGVTICNEIEHIGPLGERWLVVHGDIFDTNGPTWTLLSKLGSRAYEWSIIISKWINRYRAFLGKEPWSLALYLKRRVKKASSYVNLYERHMAEYCAKGNYYGVICGHIHEAKISTIQVKKNAFPAQAQVLMYDYVNCGDWVESCTAVVEHYNGKFEIIKWMKDHNS